MMTQAQGVIAAKVNSQTVARPKLEQLIEEKANTTKNLSTENFSFQTLAEATKTILHHAFWLAEQQQKLSLKEYKKLLSEQGWKGEEKRYLKIAVAFGKFSPQDLAQVEPRTIYQLAENSNKYQQVIDKLLDLSAITQEAVRSLAKKQRTFKEPRTEKPSIWRRLKNGGRYCQIPPIHETSECTGVTLQKMIDEEGLSAQQIVAEAIALRQAYKKGQLVVVEETK
ncbi:hypothetical protein [aff. Roholtiella sp. LEGE 12411]|uniref:hypothetical protein n=1 Tax=aff. Roholtiella sp. LEGE 12411 TaxID=1828822 RepID=UPI001880C52C|nr:hypothetical protein [aff. Roholtiella sp. LEGE 12411]MBE9036540.1 hypothetical protein [aff. Roholtiella sp. LEGE 12411]